MDWDCLVQAMEPGHTPRVGGWVGLPPEGKGCSQRQSLEERFILGEDSWERKTKVSSGQCAFLGWLWPWLWAAIQPGVWSRPPGAAVGAGSCALPSHGLLGKCHLGQSPSRCAEQSCGHQHGDLPGLLADKALSRRQWEPGLSPESQRLMLGSEV